MAIQPTYPGVYVQELPSGTHMISGVSTSTTAFIGYLASGPLGTPVQCLNFGDFQREFGGLDAASPTSFQVSQFFLNGGSEAWVSRLAALPTGFDIAGSLQALDAMPIVNLIAVPDMAAMAPADYATAATAVLNYALQRKAFAILDIPATIQTPNAAVDWMTNVAPTFGPGLISGAAYFPQVEIPTPPDSHLIALGASGTMAGVYAATDVSRGVWKAPAGITAPLTNVQQLQYVMTDAENGLINPLGMNALRNFPIYGNVPWGARTLASANVADDDWKYISVRRLALYIEQSLVQGLQWVVFEPNDERLGAQIRLSVNSFLQPLFQQGAFVGSTPAQAYQVICDASTTTPEDMDNGIVNILILFAPVKPAEFVVISIQLMAGQSAS